MLTLSQKEMSSYNFVSQYLFPGRVAVIPSVVISGYFKSKIVLKLYFSIIISNRIMGEKWKHKLLARFLYYMFT